MGAGASSAAQGEIQKPVDASDLDPADAAKAIEEVKRLRGLLRENAPPAASGRTVVVVGGGSGIGKATVQRLAKAGGTSVICVDRVKARAESTAGDNVKAVVADMNLPVDIAKIKAAVGDAPVHALVFTAAVLHCGGMLELKQDEFTDMIATASIGPLFTTQALAPNLKAAGGEARVLLLGAAFKSLHLPTMGAYCIAKMATKRLQQSLAADCADFAVGYAEPGLMDCEETGSILKEHLANTQTGGEMAPPIRDMVNGRLKDGDRHTAGETAEWVEALLNKEKCATKDFKEAEHQIWNPATQYGVKITLTQEQKGMEAAK